jgi:hypothetical protein
VAPEVGAGSESQPVNRRAGRVYTRGTRLP